MERLKLKDLRSGNTYQTALMIREITEKKDKNGRAYLVVKMSDGEDEADMFVWDASAEGFQMKPGNVCNVTVSVTQYNDRPSYSLKNLSIDPSLRVIDFVPSAPVDPEVLYAECLEKIEGMKNDQLKRLTKAIYTDYRDKLVWWGAAKAVHHTRTGELLWHVVRMERMAEEAAKQYEYADRDLLISGILLHDIGKLFELETSEFGITDYTIPGQLCGHAFLGAEVIRKYAQKTDLSPELTRLLVHIILSHHGKAEYGAVTKPATIEAAIVHYLDMMDSHLYIYEKEYERVPPGSLSDSKAFLDNAKVYHPDDYDHLTGGN